LRGWLSCRYISKIRRLYATFRPVSHWNRGTRLWLRCSLAARLQSRPIVALRFVVNCCTCARNKRINTIRLRSCWRLTVLVVMLPPIHQNERFPNRVIFGYREE
jgi:hypothetical protein